MVLVLCKISKWITLLALTAPMLGPSSLAICFAADGELNLETALGPCDGSKESSESQFNPTAGDLASLAPEHACECHHVRLGLSQPGQTNEASFSIQPASSWPAIAPIDSGFRSVLANPHGHGLGPPTGSIQISRSILLC